jgi:hypothetical protein
MVPAGLSVVRSGLADSDEGKQKQLGLRFVQIKGGDFV